MGATALTTDQIGSVNRDDFDVSTAGKAVVVKIIAGTNITIGSTGVDTGTGDVTINASAGGSSITWTVVSGTSQTGATNNGYVTNNASLVTVSLPTTAAVGDMFYVIGMGAGLWKISQAASQIIHFGNVDSTTGTGGYLQATLRRDTIQLMCTVANLEFTVVDSIGNITMV